MKGSDNQEKLVYQIIEDAGNKGKHVKEEAGKNFLVFVCRSRNREWDLASQAIDLCIENAAMYVKRRGDMT